MYLKKVCPLVSFIDEFLNFSSLKHFSFYLQPVILAVSLKDRFFDLFSADVRSKKALN